MLRFKASSDSFRIRQRVELTVPATQLGHLLGAEGRRHKEITERTNTRIHFDNAPYTSKSKFSASPRFDLDAFQSAAPLRATMSGSCKEDVQNAIEDLQSLDRATKVCQVFLIISHRMVDFIFQENLSE